MVPGTPAIAGAVIARKLRMIIQAFYDHFAFDEHTALTKEQLGIFSLFLFKRLVSRGVIKETPDGRYYLDEEEKNKFFEARRKRAFIAIAVVMILFILVMIYFYS